MIAQINGLDSSLNKAAEAFNAANVGLDRLKRQLVTNQQELTFARANLKKAHAVLGQRLVALYTADQSDNGIAILLGASSLDDLLNRIDAQNRIGAQDAQLVRQVAAFRTRVARERTRLESARAWQASLVAERSAQRQRIAGQLGQRRRLLASVQGEIARLRAAERARQVALERQARARLAAEAQARREAAASGPASPTSAPSVSLGVAAATPEASVPPPATHGGVVGIAMRYLGVPYVWGGSSPRGFDCSGFTMYVYAQIGVSLPHYTGSQYAMGTAVSRDQLQPGDLVFFDGLGHEGIYIGGNQFIHAPHTGDVVKISSISGWYASTYVGARRL